MDTWVRRTQWPLVGLALLFLAAYAAPVIDPEMPRHLKHVCFTTTWFTWGCFLVDYLVRLWLADKKLSFVKSNMLDLVTIVLPMFQPLRAVRLLTLIRVINRTATGALRGRVGAYLALGSTLLAFVSSLAVLQAERGSPHATINGFGDAAWWSITTMTTVGYGDTYPTTTTGRIVGAILMVAGIALLGAVTAGIATWLIDNVSDVGDDTAEIESDVQALRSEIATLTAEVRRLRAMFDDGTPPG